MKKKKTKNKINNKTNKKEVLQVTAEQNSSVFAVVEKKFQPWKGSGMTFTGPRLLNHLLRSTE